MKKYLLLFGLFLMISAAATAQKGEKMQALKIAYVTKALNLTETEAQQFWPVYNKYYDELKAAREANKSDEIAFEEKSLEIRKRYKKDFKKILVDDERVNKTLLIDKNFAEFLRKRLQERKKNKKPAAAMI